MVLIENSSEWAIEFWHERVFVFSVSESWVVVIQHLLAFQNVFLAFSNIIHEHMIGRWKSKREKARRPMSRTRKGTSRKKDNGKVKDRTGGKEAIGRTNGNDKRQSRMNSRGHCLGSLMNSQSYGRSNGRNANAKTRNARMLTMGRCDSDPALIGRWKVYYIKFKIG